MEQEEETGSSEPPQNGLCRVCVCGCAYIYFVHQPRLRQRTSKPLVFPISCDVRYVHIPGVLSDLRKGMTVLNIVVLVGEIGRNFSEKFSLSKSIQVNNTWFKVE